jgi:hypothetical protein
MKAVEEILMRALRVTALVLMVVTASLALAADETHPAAPTNPMWEKMKTL